MTSAERTIRMLLEKAGIEPGGSNPWDLQVHNPDLYARVSASNLEDFARRFTVEGFCRNIRAALEQLRDDPPPRGAGHVRPRHDDQDQVVR